MKSSIFSLIGFVIGGLIVADIVTHPAGTKAASTGIEGIVGPTSQALIGR